MRASWRHFRRAVPGKFDEDLRYAIRGYKFKMSGCAMPSQKSPPCFSTELSRRAFVTRMLAGSAMALLPAVSSREAELATTLVTTREHDAKRLKKTMTKNKLLRMDNVGIVVEDLKAAIAFFVELGLELEGEMTVEGQWVDRVVGLDGVRNDIAMMRTPDGHSRLELMKFQKPTAISAEPNAAVNTLGIRRIMFAVEDIEDVLGRLEAHGAKLVGELAQYEDKYRLCYVRGPEGIIVALAEQIG
jgi:catechol 2,3-dioxygenase-like lactoylglutathione lyase family enzyme